MTTSAQVTRLLADCRRGEQGALKELLPYVYDELHSLAQRQMGRERGDHTLQPTALVNEAWMRLIDQKSRDWENRTHFLAIAATAMRRVLMHHAEKRGAQKRGGDRGRVTMFEAASAFDERSTELLALDEALERLAAIDEQKAKIVELRFFGGLTVEEVSEVLGISTRTVERGWRFAKAWLRKDIGEAR